MTNHRRYLEHIDKDVLISYLCSLIELNNIDYKQPIIDQLNFLNKQSVEFEKAYPPAKMIMEDMENEN